MKKIKGVICLVLLLSSILCACGQQNKTNLTYSIMRLYNEAMQNVTVTEVEISAKEKAVRQRHDEKIWNKAVLVSNYLHSYDRWLKDETLIKSERLEVLRVTEEADSWYKAPQLSSYIDSASADYVAAVKEYHSAAQHYSTAIVNYAQFGGSDNYGTLHDAEDRVAAAQEAVVKARIEYQLVSGLLQKEDQ